MKLIIRVLVITGVVVALMPTMATGRGTSLRMTNPPFIEFPPIPSLVGPIGDAFILGRSRGKVSRDDNCRLTIRLKGLDVIPPSDGIPGTGDEIVCLLHVWMDFDGPRFGTLITRGEVGGSSGAVDMGIRAKFGQEPGLCTRIGQFLKGTDSYYESRGVRCYEPDPSYAPEITAPFGSDPTQGFVLGGYAPRPASPLIATEGLFFR